MPPNHYPKPYTKPYPSFDENDYDYISINGVGIQQLTHPHFEEWFKYIITDYEPPKPPKIGIFMPCSAIKPYHRSPIHKVINKEIAQYKGHIHEIVISNAGIVPYEFSDQYPFNSYDWNPQFETEDIKNKYIEITINRLISFFNKHSTRYNGFISYFRPDAEELIALKVSSQIANINIIHIDVNIKDCDDILQDTSDRDLVLTLEHNLEKLKQTLTNISYNQPNPNPKTNPGDNMVKRIGRIHHETEIKLDIYSKDIIKDAQEFISTTLKKVWPDTYLYDLDPEDYTDIVVDLWLRYYITSDQTKQAIDKIKSNNPPKDLKIYLVFSLFDNEDNLIIDYSEMHTEPFFRSYLPTNDLWDTYVYSCTQTPCKFESLEIIEPDYIIELKQEMSEQEKTRFDDIILQSYSFHNRLLSVSSKKILLYTAQQPNVIEDWNRKHVIPKGIYFTDKMIRAEYYWSEGDIIVDYRLPETEMVITSEFGGAKEYVTINDIQIK